MRVLRFLILTCLAIPLFAAGSGPEAMDLPSDGLSGPTVYLPGDVSLAQEMLWGYNKAMSSTSHLQVPTMDQIGAPPYQSWENSLNFLACKKWCQEHPDSTSNTETPIHERLHFALYKHAVGENEDDRKLTGVCVLYVSNSEVQQALETYVINASMQLGIPPPTPKETQAGRGLWEGISTIASESGLAQLGWGNYMMIAVALLLIYLGITRGFEPLLLIPIGIGCIFVNAMGADMTAAPTPGQDGGILYYFVTYGIGTGIFPLLIFLGVGALTDFGPLLANPWSALLGAAAQIGIFGSFFLASLFGVFTLQECGAIAIIGGADGPTSIFLAAKLAPHLLGPIAVAAYSYMALVPIIQPPIMRALTNDDERKIMMTQRKSVSKTARILFPLSVFLLCLLVLPSAVPLIGMLMFGNLMRECGVVDRLSKTAQNELINLVTIALGLSVGTKLAADAFLNWRTLLIVVLGCAAFMLGTAGGVVMAKIMNKMTGGRINPLIGSAGVSAVPMAARVSHSEGQRYNKQNFLLMHAMGPNVAGVIGSAVAAGILLALLG